MQTIFSADHFWALATFAFVITITPGPNNIMLTASGLSFGFVRTIPHIFGIAFGVALMHIGIGLGLGVLFTSFAIVQYALRFLGSLYLLFLAYKMLSFVPSSKNPDSAQGQPFTLLQAAAFQMVNPKAWVLVISANASFSLSGSHYWPSIALIVITFMVIGLPSIMTWAAFGHGIRNWLDDERALKWFNRILSAATALCVVFIWI